MLAVAFLPSRDLGRGPKIRAVRAKADAFVSQARRNANFGRGRELRVDASPPMRIYVRFKLDPRGEEVKHVSLLLWSRSPSRMGYQVRLAPERWRERRITYENAPRPSGPFESSGPVGGKAWKAVNVTSLAGDASRDLTFAITTASPNGGAFASREAGLHGPRLVVETEQRETTTGGTTTEPESAPE